MSGHKNVIELNGKLYDSTTGTIINSAASTHHTKPSHTSPALRAQPKTTGHVLDGFVRRPKSHQPHAQKHPAPAHPVHVAAPAKHKSAKTAANHAAHHAPHRSHTLMRRGLKKPSWSQQHSDNQASTINHAHHAKLNPARAARAEHTATSPNISRFGSLSGSLRQGFVKKTAPLPVQPAPTHHHKASKAHVQATHHIKSDGVAVPTHNQLVKEHLVSQAIKNARVPEPHAKSNKAPRKHRVAKKLGVSPKVVHFGSATFAVLLLVGFIAYQNAPNISMQIASARAGFSASIPGYKPAGFGLSGPIEYGPGQVTINFKSNSDNRNFHVTQKVSNWNSDALLANFVTTGNKTYQTFQDKGRTIYIYDGSNATWVSGGVWYQIEGNSSLSSDQLIRLASSI